MRFIANPAHKSAPWTTVARKIVAKPFQPGCHMLGGFGVCSKSRAGQRSNPAAGAHFRTGRPRSVRKLPGAKKVRGPAEVLSANRFCGIELRAQRPAGWLDPALFTGVKSPAAIGILQV